MMSRFLNARDQISYLLSVTTGLILFAGGVYGLVGIPLQMNPFLTVLLTPLGWGERWDSTYYFILAMLGFWLTLCLHVRIPAAIALGLVLGKIILLGQLFQFGILLPLALIINLYLLLYRMVTNGQWFQGQDPEDIDENFW